MILKTYQGVQFIQCQEGTSIMESLEMCLPGGLHELGFTGTI